MGQKVNIGGDRLGTGAKMEINLHGFERSTHDLSYGWRSSMAVGTIVPFMSEVILPGDTFDIKIDADVKTLPTLGPLFGSMKLQIDLFMCPVRLYQGLLHTNMLKIGNNMDKVCLPLIEFETPNKISESGHIEDFSSTYQVNPSSLIAYLGVRGIGWDPATQNVGTIKRRFNAVPLLAYWDIYKNYYANKQEEVGAYIVGDNLESAKKIESIRLFDERGSLMQYPSNKLIKVEAESYFIIKGKNLAPEDIEIIFNNATTLPLQEVASFMFDGDENTLKYTFEKPQEFVAIRLADHVTQDTTPAVKMFPLENIDTMKKNILKHLQEGEPYVLKKDAIEPYNAVNKETIWGMNGCIHPMQGLGLKTYQSDIFNNWISTEWIDGENGISAVTAIDVSDGKLNLDALNLSQKVYNMLNRVAVSGGSVRDWVRAVYDVDANGSAESPVYVGGMSREIGFEEVVSNAETNVDGTQPLGTIAGKGAMYDGQNGGNIYVNNREEPAYIIGMVSITPRVCYSQGNHWDTRLRTMDDFHKPSLDGIGYQDLVTEQMAWWDTHGTLGSEVLRSAGKQPAWLNYMTNYSRSYGNFADENMEMFMTLNRKYEINVDGNIKDLTTYIEPQKYNYAFAQTDLTSQNFWTSLHVGIQARRKISAKQIPNL